MTLKTVRCIDGGGTHKWARTSANGKRCVWCRAEAVAKTLPPKPVRAKLPAQSAKRRAIAGERAEFVAVQLRRRPRCEFPPLVAVAGRRLPAEVVAVLQAAAAGCTSKAVDVHEVVGRGRGGAIVPSQGLTPADVLCLCRACHEWVTTHPAAATEAGALQPGASRPDLTNRKDRQMTDTRMDGQQWTRYVAPASEDRAGALESARMVAVHRAGCRVVDVAFDADEQKWLAVFEGGSRS